MIACLHFFLCIYFIHSKRIFASDSSTFNGFVVRQSHETSKLEIDLDESHRNSCINPDMQYFLMMFSLIYTLKDLSLAFIFYNEVIITN